MSEVSPEHTPVPAPSEDEIRKAVRTLLHAWHPTLLLPGEPGYEEYVAGQEEYDPYDGCGCAGTDEDGNPLGCNCGDGCGCDSCSYYAYSRDKICQAGNASFNTRCTRETAFRVITYRMQHSGLSARRAEGEDCPHQTGMQQDACHCTERSVFYESGLHPVTYWTLTACSIPCAQQIIAQTKASRGDGDDLQYYIERFTYEPHDRDLPAELAALRMTTGMAKSSATWLADLVYTGRTAQLETYVQAVRERIALAALHVLAPLEPADDDVWNDEVTGPVQEEPSQPDAPE